MLKVQILVDNPKSWIVPYTQELVALLKKRGVKANLIHDAALVEKGDILCLLSCERIFKNLHLNKHNLVVHESDLPKGKGWSPVTWQVLEKKDRIPVTLFEAVEAVDAGPIYAQEYMELTGAELLEEIKHKQGLATQKVILEFVEAYPRFNSQEQVGEESFYRRRDRTDSKLDVNKSLAEQFDLLRVCDNERYPAYFVHRNQKYTIKIYKEDDK